MNTVQTPFLPAARRLGLNGSRKNDPLGPGGTTSTLAARGGAWVVRGEGGAPEAAELPGEGPARSSPARRSAKITQVQRLARRRRRHPTRPAG